MEIESQGTEGQKFRSCEGDQNQTKLQSSTYNSLNAELGDVQGVYILEYTKYLMEWDCGSGVQSPEWKEIIRELSGTRRD